MTTEQSTNRSHTTFRRLDLGGIARDDYDTDRGRLVQTVHAARIGDTSPTHSTYPTGYDSACGWCWLGAGHTVDAHTAQLAEVTR